MPIYDLTEEQRDLLCKAVKAIRENKTENLFHCFWGMNDPEILGIPGTFTSSLETDLIALGQAGLIILNSSGQRDVIKFSVKQSAFYAVDHNFIVPGSQSRAGISIGNWFSGNISGGNVQAVGFSSQSEFQQIINDPNLLNEKIDECLNKLIELVRGELTRKQEVQYLTAAEQFKEEITSGKPDSTKMQRLLRTLAFLGDIEGTIALAARVWASLAPLVMIAAQLIHQ